jgi:hypothetical protein
VTAAARYQYDVTAQDAAFMTPTAQDAALINRNVDGAESRRRDRTIEKS